MTRQRGRKQNDSDAAVPALRHVAVVGGTPGEWDALGDERWAARRSDLAKVVAHAGAAWLSIRPYEADAAAGAGTTERFVDVREGCTVVVDPAPDGRARLLAAIAELQQASVAVVDDAALSAVLMAPAPCEPDLVVILGPSHRLPPSLVWELAYAELVFVDAAWADLAAAHVEQAIDDYSHRHRRFGGIG